MDRMETKLDEQKGCRASCRISPLTQELLTCGVSTINGCVWLCDDCIDSLAQEEDERNKTKLTKEDLESIFILMYPMSSRVMTMKRYQKDLRKLRIMLKEASK